MIQSSQSKIAEYTARGWWGDITLDDLLTKAVNACPARLAVADAPNRAAIAGGASLRLRYAELDAAIDSIAAQLIQLNVGADDIVLVQMPNIVEALVLLLACGRIGAIASPVAVQYREHELSHIVGKLKPKVYATVCRCGDFKQANMAARVIAEHDAEIQLVALGEDLPATAVPLTGLVPTTEARARVARYLQTGRPSANDIFTICWTSGTESQPKGVPRSHNHWIAIGKVVESAPQLRDGDVLMGSFPMTNMAAIGGVMVPWLLCRGTVVLHHPFDLGVFLGQIQDERINYNLAPPPILNMLLKQKELLAKFDISSLRAVCSGSAPLAPWMVQGWQDEYHMNIINYFGSNEGVALASSSVDVPDPVERAGYFPRYGVAGFTWAAGKTIAFETRLRDTANGEIIVTPGREGELCIRGATVFDGYYDEPEMTRAAFDEEGFFRTGDLFVIAGAKDNPKYYKFVGRCKEIVIRGGQNISPAEMDNLIASHPAVTEAACIGIPDEAMGERLCAVVVLRPNTGLTLEELTAFLKDHQVAIFKWPERLVIVNQLPRNPVGKVVRRELRVTAQNTQQN
ncbi:MAG: acyl--CoA ligase [Zoogloeaceae bacterium]|jgi:acyl-CoA synthetase (AMP-forming)/AMP-acid ligase II|nr:acyl--CoA ligase [Zoogloeaceae bacterium]